MYCSTSDHRVYNTLISIQTKTIMVCWQSLPANVESMPPLMPSTNPVGAGRFRVVAEELYAPLYFLTRLFFGHIGANAHLCHDFFLKFTHISSVRGRRLAEGTKDNADTLKIHRIFCSKDLIYRCF